MKKGLGILFGVFFMLSCSSNDEDKKLEKNTYPQQFIRTSFVWTSKDFTNDGKENFVKEIPYSVSKHYEWECNINASGKILQLIPDPIVSTNPSSTFKEYIIDSYQDGFYSTHDKDNNKYELSFGMDKVDVDQKVTEGIINIVYSKLKGE